VCGLGVPVACRMKHSKGMFKRWLWRAGKRPWKAKQEKFHTCGGPRRRPSLGQGRGRRRFIHIQGFETPLKLPPRRARLWRLYKTHIPCELFVTHGFGHSYLYQKVPLLTLVLNPRFFCWRIVFHGSGSEIIQKMFMWFPFYAWGW
jgi:hypothetical protein